MEALTPIQSEVAEYCRSYLSNNDCLPTTRELQRKFGWGSQTTGLNTLRALVKKGIMEISPESKRLRFVRGRAYEALGKGLPSPSAAVLTP